MNANMRYVPIIAAIAVFSAGAAVAGVDTHDAASVSAGTYQLDPSHTLVAARVNHMGFSTTTVRFPKASGTFVYDPAHPQASSLDVTIDTASLSSDWTARDNDLKSPAFFNVAAFPQARFVASSLLPVDNSHARIDGQLTLLGVTRPVDLTVTLLAAGKGMMGDQRAGFEAHAHINRSDFGMKTFLPMVGDGVDIAIDAEFSKSNP
jgi:polyisoprenoid-binding protein YceI